MSKDIEPINLELISSKILTIRNNRVMIATDLAELYGVTTRRLNEQVKRNIKRFPQDFMFQLTEKEKKEVIANCDHLKKLKYSPHLPFAFTEHGAVMLASVLNSATAINTSIQVVRAFMYMRQMIIQNKDLEAKINKLEKKYDEQFKVVFGAIKQLLVPPDKKKMRIGF
jgi:hypothetical protein